MAKIAVVYYSKSGNTEKMAQLVAEGCKQVPGAEVSLVKLPRANLDEVLDADGYCIGSPDYFSYVAGHVKTFFDEALQHKQALSGKPFAAFGTHGGGARVLGHLEQLGQAIGLRRVREGLMCQGAPKAQDEDACRALGRAVAEAAGS